MTVMDWFACSGKDMMSIKAVNRSTHSRGN